MNKKMETKYLTSKDGVESAIEMYNNDMKYFKDWNVKSTFLRGVQKHLGINDEEFKRFAKDYRC